MNDLTLFFRHFFTASLPHIGVINMNQSSTKHRIAIFASGAGSNAKQIITHFAANNTTFIEAVVCNKTGSGVIDIAHQFNIPVIMIEKNRFEVDGYVAELTAYRINFIVLAGFLWKIPEVLIKNYSEKIVNIHPALLPKYGGKGMYGKNVHQAVLQAHEQESGITIHWVDEQYDHGKVIFQATCPVLEGDTAETLGNRVHLLEHAHYPVMVEKVLQGMLEIEN